MKRLKRLSAKFSLTGIVGNVLLAASLSVLPVSAQQIITDGNTATNLNVSGSTTTVTTTTTKGANAFNSFSKFNVDAGNKVELVVPDASNNLINLIHDEASVINGTLNSIKAGQVGGNIFLVNPHGITVGAQGVINVGSLTAVTPTTDFMNTFFTAPGDPADASITALINGTAPINASATIDNQGKINAITDIKIDTGIFNNSGEMYTDASYGLDMGDIVNLNSLDYVADNDPENLVLDQGIITLKGHSKDFSVVFAIDNRGGIASQDLLISTDFDANDIYLAGNIYSSNDINISSGHYVHVVGNINAGNDFTSNTYLGIEFVNPGHGIKAGHDVNISGLDFFMPLGYLELNFNS